MTLSPGTRLGPYEIDSLIGAGGMGQVYKARDTRLDRTVALKLLPADLAERPDRRSRFETEARAISSLSHQHICALFDVGEVDGRAFLVMEHLDGETLEDRLADGPLPAADVLRFGAQIADALDHAHRAHIVHRDLKPSNVMMTRLGPKLLDFGLAKRSAADQPGIVTTASFGERKLTAEGAVIGTLQYMAPEQLEGHAVDARTDIFSFGVLLYEMATARKAFDGQSQAGLIASILTAQPPPIASSPSATSDRRLPPAFDHILQRCMAKSPAERWQAASDIKLELDWLAKADATVVASPPRNPWLRRVRVLLALAAAVIVVVMTGAILLNTRDVPAEIVRFETGPPAGTILGIQENRGVLAVSPNGRYVAFVASTGGRSRLWVRSDDSLDARPLEGTDGATAPFWSPDGQFIGFFNPANGGELRKVDRDGGPPRTICAARFESQATWAADGTILFTQLGQGIFRVSADGGEATQLTRLDRARRQRNHFWPSMLPDSRRFLYMATALDENGVRETPTIYAGSVDGSPATPITQMHSRMTYVDPGRVLFVQDATLFAQPFDVSQLRLTGEPTRIVDRVAYYRTIGTAHFAASANGVLVYQRAGDPFDLVWYDRQGKITASGWPPQVYGFMRIAPDGDRVAVDIVDPRTGMSDIWIYDIGRGGAVRATEDPHNDGVGGWSSGGRQLVFRSDRSGVPGLFTKTIGGIDEPLTDISALGSLPQNPNDWSQDGKWIVYVVNTTKARRDLMLVPLAGDRNPRAFANSPSDEYDAAFSPDSSRVAFVSDESGQPEIYVAPIQQAGDKRAVSIGGGTTPRWRRDGRELFYATPGNRSIVAVPIEQGTTLKIGMPVELFTLGRDYASRHSPRNTAYDASPDGQRFLVSVAVGEPTSSRITVVQNWMTLLKR